MSSPAALSLRLSAGALAVLLLSACGEDTPPADPAAAMPPPPQVTVMTASARDVPLQFDYIGRLEAVREVEIRPRVAGLIEERLYDEGSLVKAGTPLFRIDPAPFAAAERAAAGVLADAKAQLTQAEREIARLRPLVAARAVSRRELDDAKATLERARAAVKTAAAELARAELDRDYSEVLAPIAGVAGRALQVEGALVAPDAGPLTTVTQIDPIYVRYAVPEDDRLAARRDEAAGNLQLPAAADTAVELQLADGTRYPRRGRVDFRAYSTNATTGAFDARAKFPNPEGLLRPGQFVRVRVIGAVRTDAITVPQRAVMEGPTGKFVYVVGKGPQGMPIAEPRPVTVGEWVELPAAGGTAQHLWIIRAGLKPGDPVIVDGMARIFFPGMPVQPDNGQPPAPPATPPAAS